LKTKKGKYLLLVIFLTVTFLMAAAFSYSGYSKSVQDCRDSGGTVTEDQLGFLAVTWSVSCEE
jgi:hypothetical protein